MKKASKSPGVGLIKTGGDTFGYLGHFRSPKVQTEGHNFGFPGSSAKDTPGGFIGGLFGGGSDKPKLSPAQQYVQRTKAKGMKKDIASGMTKNQAYAEEHPVFAAKRQGRINVQKARAAGGDVNAAKAARNAAVSAAKENPKSALSESAAFKSQRHARSQRRKGITA